MLQGGKRGEPPIVPGKPGASPILHLVKDKIEDLEMPPLGKPQKFPVLSTDEMAKLSGWIAQGANWPEGAILHLHGN